MAGKGTKKTADVELDVNAGTVARATKADDRDMSTDVVVKPSAGTGTSRRKKSIKAAFIGDLHFYDGVTKAHKDYYANCIDCMDRYTKEFEKSKPDYIFIAGDLVGLSERVLRSRAGLMRLINILNRWNAITKNKVYCVRGNHDMPKAESVSDYDVLLSAGIIKHADDVTLNGLRVHLVDYGDEQRQLNIYENHCNVALVHENLMIDGITNWYRADEGVQLSSLKNFKGIELVLAGHIHDPSPTMHSTSIDNWTVTLLYLGCATRPKRRDHWNAVYVVYANCEADGEVVMEHTQLMLKDWQEIFNEESAKGASEAVADAEDDVPRIDMELLKEILSNLQPIMTGTEETYREQIRRLAGADKAAAELAMHYIDLADEHAKMPDARPLVEDDE